MKKCHPYILIALLLSFCLNQQTGAQSRERRRGKIEEEGQKKEKEAVDQAMARVASGAVLHYVVENGDTIYVDNIRPSIKWGSARKEKRDWKKYTKLVYNFSQAYPYAMVAKHLVHEADSTFAAERMKRRKREKYVNDLQDQLFEDFEETVRNHITVSQGQLIIKLIDREAGKNSYDLIKEYKSGLAAGFWQGIAKIFDSDLKTGYDPLGADYDTEQLVILWQRGEFPAYYYSIFGQYPNIPEVPLKYK